MLGHLNYGSRATQDQPLATPLELKLHGANKDQRDQPIQAVRIFAEDIRMSLGLEECAVLEMKRGRKHMGGVEEGYRYLFCLKYIYC